MSEPQDRPPRPRPLYERSQSQNNKLGIRIVPYSPPRIASDGRVPIQPSTSQENPPKPARGLAIKGIDGSSNAGPIIHRKWADDPSDDGKNVNQAPGVSSFSTASPSLAAPKDEGASGSRAASGRTLPQTPAAAAPTPALRSPSHGPGIIFTDVNVPTQHGQQPGHQDAPATPSPTSNPARGLSRRGNLLSIHEDKTFSIVLQKPGRSGPRDATSLSQLSASTVDTASSHERLSDAFTEDPADSTFTTAATIPDRSPSPRTPQRAEDPVGASPWSYHLVGGLRDVPETPAPKQKWAAHPTSAETPPLGPLPEASAPDEPQSHALTSRTSFGSGQTDLTASETTNYKVYGPRSPERAESCSSENLASLPSIPSRPSSRCSDSTNVQILGVSSTPAAPLSSSRPPSGYSYSTNIQILGVSSPAAPFESSRPVTSDSEKFALYADSSTSSSLVTISRRPYRNYSQESLLVLPLKPGRRNSRERFGPYASRSRESLRRQSSIKSTRSISSAISQNAAHPFLAAPALMSSPRRSPSQQNNNSSSQACALWATSPGASDDASRNPQIQMLQAHPHVWSSQLSTIGSESEEPSSRSHSRVVSSAAGQGNSGLGPAGRTRSSVEWPSGTHSRHVLSISSSLAQQLEEGSAGPGGPRPPPPPRSHSRSHSGSDPLDRPQAALTRGGQGQSLRTVRDQDEHGDGLADLQDLSSRPPRSGLPGFFGSSSSSDRGLHSSASTSSRTGSFMTSSIPTWARLYYGGGERRLVSMPSMSSISEASRPNSSWRSGSPNTDHLPASLYSPRKRPRDGQQQPSGAAEPPEIGPATPPATHVRSSRRQSRQQRRQSAAAAAAAAGPSDEEVQEQAHLTAGAGVMRRKTSSVWSPHLRVDRRAAGRFSMWEPPSVTWSAEGAVTGRRSVQVAAFILGFIFPFAWMIAACLPLPPVPDATPSDPEEAAERGQGRHHHGQSQFGGSHKLAQYAGTMDELRYQSAKWWRTLNRAMSVIGLLLVGTVIALVVLGVKDGWR